MNAINTIREITDFLRGSGIESAAKEAEILLHHCAGIDTVAIYRDNPVIPKSCLDVAEGLARRRASREPLAYLIGEVEFLNLRLSVGPGVLIPRPETECMAEYTIETIRKLGTEHTPRFLDLCTGSGCLALALAREYPASDVYAGDVSEAAIFYARKNALVNRLSNIRFFVGDLLEPLTTSKPAGRFDLIISNPPYIQSGDLNGLQPEIRDWEPRNALDGGKSGLYFYRVLIPAARDYLKTNGLLIFEIGAGGAHEITDMLGESGFSRIQVIKDYAGIERVVQATWKNLS